MQPFREANVAKPLLDTGRFQIPNKPDHSYKCRLATKDGVQCPTDPSQEFLAEAYQIYFKAGDPQILKDWLQKQPTQWVNHPEFVAILFQACEDRNRKSETKSNL